MPSKAEAPTTGQDFSYHMEMERFAVTQQAYLGKQTEPCFDFIATGAFIFDSSPENDVRILLLQRAASDSMPNCWEVPGGGCQDTDDSILAGAARELWEEAGLTTRAITHALGDPYYFSSRSGKRICQLNFLVEAQRNPSGQFNVKLNPEEHQKFIWVTKKEVEAKRYNDLALEFTATHQHEAIIAAFQVQDSVPAQDR